MSLKNAWREDCVVVNQVSWTCFFTCGRIAKLFSGLHFNLIFCSFRSDSDSEEESDSDSPPKKRTYKGRLQDMVGKVMLMETEDRKRTFWVPTLVVTPNASDMELKHNDHLLLKSFKDSK